MRDVLPLFLLCCLVSVRLAGFPDRPNIIFILTDDQRYDALGYAGNPLTHTPEMDRLAARGTWFSHATVSTPICAASRASLLSGTYERTHRFTFETGDMREAHMQAAYPRVLRAAGYRTGFYGKYGVNYPHEDLLWDEYETYDRNNAYADRRGYFHKTLNGDTVHLTRYTGQQALDFVDRHAGDGQPFCLQLSFSAPHAHDAAPEQYFWQPPYDTLLADREAPAPALAAQNYFAALPAPVRGGYNRLRWTWRFDTPVKYQHSVKGYHRMIAGIDAELGKLRRKLEAGGIADNTVIIIMGDNGYFLGERQLAGKWLLYDTSVRVPLIIYDPRAPDHRESDALAQNVDVPPTILQLAGVPVPNTYQGLSLLPIVMGTTEHLPRDTALIEHLWEFGPIPPSEGVRTRDWKYFRYVNDLGSEELYRLADDALEARNLANDPAYRGTLLQLRQATDRLAVRYGDGRAGGPVNLSVDYLRRPAGLPLTADRPLLAWEVPPGAERQVAFQVLVASDPDTLARNLGDVWNSGRVRGDTSTGVRYAGPPLAAGQSYWWKVRIWDAANRLTDYSSPQAFTGPGHRDTTGYLTAANRFQIDSIAPVDVRETENGYLVDFGRDAFAALELTVDARRGGTVTVRLGELLRDGHVDPDPGGTIRFQEVSLPVRRGRHTYTVPLTPDERNTSGMAVVLPDSFPVLLPFRYVEVQGPAGQKLAKATQLAYHGYWEEDASDFTSSDPILNQVWDLCKYTIKATTFAGLYVDGDRERIPYEADAYLNQLSHYTTDREYAIGRRTIEYFMQHPTWPTEWQLHVALMFWADYMYTGNTDLIERYYDDLRWKTLVGLIGDDHLVSSGRVTPEYMRKLGFGDRDEELRDIVDWPPAQKDTGWKLATAEGERDGFVFRPNNTVINALFYRNMEIMAAFAGLLDRPDEALDFRIKALQARRAINEKLFDAERGIYVDGEGTDHASVHANMFPLAFGLVPAGYERSVGEYIKSRGMAASVYGAQYLMEALYAAGMQDYALALLTDTTDRSWYNMIRSGSTMAMEAWDLKYKPNLDLNHAWGAVPANIIPRQLWGIQPATPGYGRARIAPQFGALESCSIRVPTLRGAIVGTYRRRGNRKELELTIPATMVAEVDPAGLLPGRVELDGVPAEPGFATLRLGPGTHTVTITGGN